MKRTRWLALAGMVVTLGVFLAGAAVAWGDDSVTPICNGEPCSTTPSTWWYTAPVTLTWQVNPPANQYIGCNELQPRPGDLVATESCEAVWAADDIKRSYTLHVEISNPTASATVSRPPDVNGWYNHPVSVSWSGRSFSGIASCIPATTYGGPDTLGTTVGGTCTDNAGKRTPQAGVTLHYDATPPTISAVTPSRPADAHGWYNHPVTFSFAGTDATSGIEGCSSPTYAGPGNANAAVIGSCTDRAGNVATLAVPLRYASTPPSLDVSSSTGDHLVALRWHVSTWPAPLASLEITRTSVARRGSHTVIEHPGNGTYRDTHVTNFVRYRYTITATDQAGNVTVRTVTATPGPRLIAPRNGVRLDAPPLLRWTPVRRADYYNVQLFRGGRKVLSTWPTAAKLKLRRSWSFGGRRRRLKPGHYHWYVWPGYGPRRATRYGRLIGRGGFVMVPRR